MVNGPPGPAASHSAGFLRRVGTPGSGRYRAHHSRADRGRALAGRGTATGLVGLDLGVPGHRALPAPQLSAPPRSSPPARPLLQRKAGVGWPPYRPVGALGRRRWDRSYGCSSPGRQAAVSRTSSLPPGGAGGCSRALHPEELQVAQFPVQAAASRACLAGASPDGEGVGDRRQGAELTHPCPTVLCHGQGCARPGGAEERRLGRDPALWLSSGAGQGRSATCLGLP